MADTATLEAIGRKTLNDQQDAVNQWAAATGVQSAPPARAQGTAEGTITFGGAIANAVLIEMTFDSGEKRNFNGMLFGVAGGLTEGVGIYIGTIPDDGEQWNMNVVAVAGVAGVVQVNFNPVWGPGGCFTCASAGAALAGPFSNYGGGHWRKG